MHIESDRALIPSNISSVRHVTVTIAAPPRRHPAHERAPVRVSLVLDRSGSMAGTKIEMARTAVAHAIRLLDAGDHLAVVVYDDRIDTILEPTAASREAKTNVLGRLATIDARGETDLAGGWARGAALASADAPTKRVLLLTDGLANRGVTDHAEMRAMAARYRDQGVATSTFGVGADFDEELLASIATHGGGHFYFIEQPQQIPDFLASELGESLEVVARDAVFDVTCGDGVEIMLLNDVPTEVSNNGVRVRLGDLVAEQEVTLAFAATFAPRPTGRLAHVDCRTADRDAALFQAPMRVEWRAADAAANELQPVNRGVLVTVADVLAQRALALALSANRRGDFDEARRVLRDMSEHLRGLAAGDSQITAIIDRLHHTEMEVASAMEPMARKSAHFAAYAASSSREVSGRARRKRDS